MKKLLKMAALTLAFLVAAGSFAACGGKTPDTETDLEIALWEAGNGREFMDHVIAAFKKKHPEISVYLSSSAEVQTGDITTGPEINSIDLYLSTMEAYLGTKKYLEPLNDVLESEVDGVVLRTKFNGGVLERMADPADGNMYVLPWSTSVGGLVYNKTLFDARGYEVPRTTNELKRIVEDAISKKDQDPSQPSPFLHYAEYWRYLTYAWQAQYDGVDAFFDTWQFKYNGEINTVKAVTDKNGGRYESLNVLYELISPKGAVYNGTNSFDHTTSQTIFLQGKALMMPNGSWVENEMKSNGTSAEIRMMKTPVISSLAGKLGITERQLSIIVASIDGETLTSQEQTALDSLQSSKPDAIEAVRAVRNVSQSEMAQFHAFVPNYASAKGAAKEFLKFYYSDEATKIIYDTTHMPSPVKLTTETVNTSGWSDFAKQCLQLHDEQTFVFKALTHPIFYLGGVKDIYHNDPARAMSATGEADRWDLERYWTEECKYWTDNWDDLCDIAGIAHN